MVVSFILWVYTVVGERGKEREKSRGEISWVGWLVGGGEMVASVVLE